MKYFILFIILFYQQSALSKRIKNYQYPVSKPYMATLLTALSDSSVPYLNYDEILIDNYPERRSLLPYPSYSKNVNNVGLLLHKGQRRPLVFVLGGFGASTAEGNVRLLAYYLHKKMGFHVLAMPDQWHWYTALTINSNVIGYFPQDIKEYSVFMKKALAKAQSRGLDFSSISITGYSLGGLRSLFLAQQDKKEKFFNFKTIVAINPPTNVLQVGNVFDKYNSVWNAYTKKQQNILVDRSYKFYFSIAEQVKFKNKNILKFVLENFPYTEKQSKAFLGNYFTTVLNTYFRFFKRFQVKKISFKKQTAPKDEISFVDYFSKFLYPYYLKRQPKLSIRAFAYRASLYSLKSFLSNSSNVFIQHNQDDVLLAKPKKDLKFLESTLKDRVFIYPTGGHLGNIWFPTNIQHFLSFFSK